MTNNDGLMGASRALRSTQQRTAVGSRLLRAGLAMGIAVMAFAATNSASAANADSVAAAGDTATLTAVARTRARLQAEAPPSDEVFALIKVVDRRTKEQVVFTRGSADTLIGVSLRGTDQAKYADTLSASAEGDVEIVTRSVRRRTAARADRETAAIAAFSHDAEDERELLARNRDSGLNPRIEGGLRAYLREHGIDLAAVGDTAQTASDLRSPESTSTIPVVISLKGIPRLELPKAPDPAQGGLIWSALDVAAERERAIIGRKTSVRTLQDDVVRTISRLGGRVVYTSWMSGLVQAVVPPSALNALAEHRDVFSIEHMSPAIEMGGVQGDDIFVATNSEDYYNNHSGWNGDTNKHPQTSRVAIAMGEQCIDINAPQWRTGGPGSASRATFYDCDPGGDSGSCSLGGLEICWNETDGNPAHGHYVASAMVADFMDGQDPGVASDSSRRKRSAPCTECRMYYMQDYNLNQRPKVEDMACELGVDIFESSLGWTQSPMCDGHGFLEDSVEALTNCDVVYVISAGNKGDSGCDLSFLQPGAPENDCTVYHPADHPWTIAVGGMQTDGACDTAASYYSSDCAYDGCASRGGGSYNGVAGKASIVDITAPFRISHALIPGTSNPVSVGTVFGTSFSAPITAGLIGQMMDWTKMHFGTWPLYGNRFRNFTLLLGDRSAAKAGTNQFASGMDKRWGAGRIGLVPFDDFNSWTVSMIDVVLAKDQTYSFSHAISSADVQYKAAVWHDGTDYSNEPDIEVTLNPSGCATTTKSYLATDNKAMLRTALNSCTGMTVSFKNVGSGSSGTRRFLFASYSAPIANERNF